MEIEFAGAAREVTGSSHILHINGKTVLLDCGMFLSRRSETRAKNAALLSRLERSTPSFSPTRTSTTLADYRC